MRKPTKQQIVSGSLAALLVAACVGLYLLQAQVWRLEANNLALSDENRDLRAKDPTTLDTCLNRAAQDYSNYIKGNGTNIVNTGGGTSYSLSSEDWRRADAKLTADKEACRTFFKN